MDGRMTSPPPVPRPNDQPILSMPPGRTANYKPTLLVMLCAFLLGAGSCFGFTSTFNTNVISPLGGVFAVGFVICLVVFLGALLWLIIKAVRDGIKGSGGVQ